MIGISDLSWKEYHSVHWLIDVVIVKQECLQVAAVGRSTTQYIG